KMKVKYSSTVKINESKIKLIRVKKSSGSKNNPVIIDPKVVAICKPYIIKKPVVFLILPMKKAVNKAKYTNPNKRDTIILMNISKLSHIYTNPLWDLKEKRYERKNSKSKEIPIDISSAE